MAPALEAALEECLNSISPECFDSFLEQSGSVIDATYSATRPNFCSDLDCLYEQTSCVKLLDSSFNVCSSEWIKNIVGIMIVALLLLAALISSTALRYTSFGALVRKSFLVRRNKIFKSTLLQLFESGLLVMLMFVILRFTGLKTKYLTQSVNGQEFTLVYTVPDSLRESLFHLLIPFAGLIFLVVWTYQVAAIIICFVTEKETRMKEVLRISGMTDLQFISSWYLVILVKSLPLAGASAAILHYGQICPNQSITTIGLFFLAFIFEMIGFSQFLTVFFNSSSRLAALANILLAYLFYFISFTIKSGDTPNANLKMCFLPPLCLNYGAQYMVTSASVVVGYDVYHYQALLPSPNICSMHMLLWGCIYSIAAWYLEYIVPQQYGIRRHWLFPLKIVQKWYRSCKSVTLIQKSEVGPASTMSSTSLIVSHLRKVYKVKSLPNGERVAVKDLNFGKLIH